MQLESAVEETQRSTDGVHRPKQCEGHIPPNGHFGAAAAIQECAARLLVEKGGEWGNRVGFKAPPRISV